MDLAWLHMILICSEKVSLLSKKIPSHRITFFSSCRRGMCGLTAGDLEEHYWDWWGREGVVEGRRGRGGVEVAVVRRHWCVEVQAEGFQKQDEVSEIFVDGCT